jgi:HEAT repeat protein
MIALAFIGKEGIPPLLAALQNQGYPSRDNALCYLVDAYENARDLKGVLPILSQYCADKDPRVAILAVILFDRLGEAAVPALCELTSNTNPEVRASAMDLLLKYGNRREPTLSALMRGLQDADARVRGAATNALERIAPEVLGTNRVSGEH